MSTNNDDWKQTSIEQQVNIPVVRQLKRPPEIWELVQPVPPKQRGSWRPLITGFASSKTMLILVVVVILCVGGYFGLQSGKRIVGTSNSPVQSAGKVDSSKAPAAAEQKSSQKSNASAPVVAPPAVQATAVSEIEKPKRKTSRQSKPIGDMSQVNNRSAVGETVSSPEASEVSPSSNRSTNQKTSPATDAKDTAGSGSVDSTSNPNSKTSLSPQLIDAQKTRPRRSKVIQWP